MIHSYNEWDHLREIVVGQAQALDHPDPNVIQEINQDLDDLCSILRDRGVTVRVGGAGSPCSIVSEREHAG